MPEPKLLVFDLDGTLIDSSRDLCDAVNATLQNEGRHPLPDSVIAGYIGDGAAMLVRRALGDPGDIDSADPAAGLAVFQRAFRFFLSYYREHKLDHTQVYGGVLEALTSIRSAHPELPMAVLTNKPVGPSRAICDALALAPFFFQNYGGDSFSTKKPDPAGLLRLIAEASTHSGQTILPEETVMVGDSDVDVLTARAIGAETIGCAYGLAPHTLRLAQPDWLVETPQEWLQVLGL